MNYTDFHIFDKRGNELPIVFDSTFKIEIPNKKNDPAIFYGVLTPENNVDSYFCKYTGSRYQTSDFQAMSDDWICSISANVTTVNKNGAIVTGQGLANLYIEQVKNSSSAAEYYITKLKGVLHNNFNKVPTYEGPAFPTVTFSTGFTFDKVSTELVETESLYILFEYDNTYVRLTKEMIEADPAIKSFCDRYKILFFIDCRNQEDFRFFDADTDEVQWSNKKILDFNDEDFRVNVGFCGNEEGQYEENIIVCLIDSSTFDENGQEAVYPIGSIHMNAEAVGEDERYRALFTNFGMPHPSEYMDVFNDTDINESKIDNIVLNKNAKKLFLAYNDIFPYVGSYKALINAVGLLGYDDIFFKEWYKEIGKTISHGSYVSYDMNYGKTQGAYTINDLTLDERIRLKKLNWISMVYKINEQIYETGEDRYGFPSVKNIHKYDDTSLLVKLIALRDWLQKYVIGLNCRIIDIAGEGVYFERYRFDGYGTYQTLLDWDNEKNIAPYVEHKEEGNVLENGDATINVNVGVEDYDVTIDEIASYRFVDYCDGYLDEDSVYHRLQKSPVDSSSLVYVGSTLEHFNELNSFYIKASSTTKNFLFNQEMLYSDDTMKSCSLRVYDNEIFFNPYDLFNNCNRQSIFIKCPIIMLERANIRLFSSNWKTSTVFKIYPDRRENTLTSYFIKNSLTGEEFPTIDYVTLVPPKIVSDIEDIITLKPADASAFSFSKYVAPTYTSDSGEPVNVLSKIQTTYGLKYSAENIYNMPMFSIKGYQFDKISADENLTPQTDYILDILDGKMLFVDDVNNRKIYLNFNFDDDSKRQTIEVNIEYLSDEFDVVKYNTTIANDENEDSIQSEDDEQQDEVVDTSFSKFIDGQTYEEFAELYKTNPDNSNEYVADHPITVHNCGEFTIDVLACDSFNNIFAAKCADNPNVTMPDINLVTFTNTAESGDPLNNCKYAVTGDSKIDNEEEGHYYKNLSNDETVLGQMYLPPDELAQEEIDRNKDLDENGVVGNNYNFKDSSIENNTDSSTDDNDSEEVIEENVNDSGTVFDTNTVAGLLQKNFIDFCIYKPTYLIPNITPVIDKENKSITVEFPSYSYSITNAEENYTARFIDITDKYNVKVLDAIEHTTSNINNGTHTYEGYSLILEPGGIAKYGKLVDKSDYDAIVAMNNNVNPEDSSEGTITSMMSSFYQSQLNYTNVNLIFFNELAGFPMVQTYADIANESAFSKNSVKNGDFKLYASDDSWQGYVWAKIKDCASWNIVRTLNYNIENEFETQNLQNWPAHREENSNSRIYLRIVEIENPDKIDKFDNEPDKIAIEEYINPTFDSSGMAEAIFDVSKFIIDNFKRSSLYWYDSEEYWSHDTGVSTKGAIVSNLEANKDLLISSDVDCDLESLSRLADFRNELIEMQNVSYSLSQLKDDMTPASTFYHNDKHTMYSYILDDFITAADDENLNIVLPYKECDETLTPKNVTTNILYDYAAVLAKASFNDYIDDEVEKMYVDYAGVTIDNNTLIEKMMNELLDASILSSSPFSPYTYYTADDYKKVNYCGESLVQLVNVHDAYTDTDTTSLACLGISRKYEEFYSLDGFVNAQTLKCRVCDLYVEKFIGFTTDPFPAIDQNSSWYASENLEFGFHIYKGGIDIIANGEVVQSYKGYLYVPEADRNNADVIGKNIYLDLEIVIGPNLESYTDDYGDSLSGYSLSLKVTKYDHSITNEADRYSILYTKDTHNYKDWAQYMLCGFKGNDTLINFEHSYTGTLSGNNLKISSIIKNSRCGLITSGDSKSYTLGEIISKIVGSKFELSPTMLRKVIRIALEVLNDCKVMTPYHSFSQCANLGSALRAGMLKLSDAFVEMRMSSADSVVWRNQNMLSLFSNTALYFVTNKTSLEASLDDSYEASTAFYDYTNSSTDALNCTTLNYAMILTMMIKSMYNVRSTITYNISYNNNIYYGILFGLYSFALYRIMYNMQSIAKLLDDSLDGFALVNDAQYVTPKFLMMTEANILPVSYNLVKAMGSALESFIFDYDNQSSIKYICTNDITDSEYVNSTIGSAADGVYYQINKDTITIYDKMVTLMANTHYNVLKERNWVLRGNVKVKETGENDDALYAVATSYVDSSVTNNGYLTDMEEIDSSSIVIDESVAIVPNEEEQTIFDTTLPDRENLLSDPVYYAKISGKSMDGYSTWTDELPDNATTTIRDMVEANYVSAYVKPTWKISVKVSLIDTSDKMYSALDPNKDYLYVTYSDRYFMPMFNIGEKVKLISESLVSNLYYAQATYKVVGYDLINAGLILEGKFNDEYINSDEDLVWHKMYTAYKNGIQYMLVNLRDNNGEEISIGEFAYDINEITSIISASSIIRDSLGNPYRALCDGVLQNMTTEDIYIFNDHKVVIDNDGKFVYTVIVPANEDEGIYEDTEKPVSINMTHSSTGNQINIYFVKQINTNNKVFTLSENKVSKRSLFVTMICDNPVYNDEGFTQYKHMKINVPLRWINGELHHRVYTLAQIYGDVLPVFLTTIKNEKLNLFISPCHHSYVDYPMVVKDCEETISGTTKLHIKYDSMVAKTFDFIDDTFSLALEEFDRYEGQAAWMDSTRLSVAINDAFPDILAKDIYGYKNATVVIPKSKNKVAFTIDLSGIPIDSTSCYNYWKVYKRHKITGEKQFVFESYNPVMFLDYDETGIYDVEAFVFDKFGNLISKMYDAAFVIK